MSKIKIKIDKHGNPTILDVCGHGANCMEATKNFEKMLGKAAEDSRVMTDSFFETYDEEVTLKQESGEADG